MDKGNIILLNGTSSAGKSTLAKTLQERLEEPYYLMSIDMFERMLPRRFDSLNDKFFMLPHMSKLYSDMGYHTIIDTVFVKSLGLLNECIKLLHEHPVLFVHVYCPAEELRRREKERGDRPIGMAEHLLSELEPKDTYDITVDTHNETLDECADSIMAMLNYPDKFSAFKTLYIQRKDCI